MKEYFLVNLMHCGKCGANITTKTRKVSGKKYFYYVCSTYNSKGKEECDQKGCPAYELEDYVLRYVINYLLEFKNNKNKSDVIELINKNIVFAENALKEIKETSKKIYTQNISNTEDYMKALTWQKVEIEIYKERLEILKKRRDFYTDLPYKNNIIEMLIKDEELLKRNFDLYIKDIILQENNAKVLFHSVNIV